MTNTCRSPGWDMDVEVKAKLARKQVKIGLNSLFDCAEIDHRRFSLRQMHATVRGNRIQSLQSSSCVYIFIMGSSQQRQVLLSQGFPCFTRGSAGDSIDALMWFDAAVAVVHRLPPILTQLMALAHKVSTALPVILTSHIIGRCSAVFRSHNVFGY